MRTKSSFSFVATGLLSILALGSILMAVLSVTTDPISEEVSTSAASWSSTFLGVLLLIIVIGVAFALQNGNRRLPF